MGLAHSRFENPAAPFVPCFLAFNSEVIHADLNDHADGRIASERADRPLAARGNTNIQHGPAEPAGPGRIDSLTSNIKIYERITS